MKKIIFYIGSMFGLSVNSNPLIQSQNLNCEENLLIQKINNAKLETIILKSNSQHSVLESDETVLISNLIENAKSRKMINSTECEIVE